MSRGLGDVYKRQLLLLALIFLYPLNKKRVEANAAKLKEIRAAREQQ